MKLPKETVLIDLLLLFSLDPLFFFLLPKVDPSVHMKHLLLSLLFNLLHPVSLGLLNLLAGECEHELPLLCFIGLVVRHKVQISVNDALRLYVI